MNSSARHGLDFPDRMFELGAEFGATIGDYWSMIAPPDVSSLAFDNDFHSDNPHAIGARQSFVPALGEIVWELPKALGVYSQLSACVYRLSDGRQIGYVRVPHYTPNKGTVSVFKELIARFESTTAVMVIDQINHPGGNMFQMYAILSMLTDRALALPQHQLSFHEDDATRAAQNLAMAEAGEAVSPERVAYSRFVLSEIEAGRRRLTNPVHLGGVEEILPAENHYTKRIVVLINELTFSAAEFLAAILQDNGRATLFGQSTPGAGGCVRRFPGNQLLGIDYITITWTIARRTSGQPIESRGVNPDVRYSLTAEDLQSDFGGYRQALLTTISA